MRIIADGKVGIGTTVPTLLLDISAGTSACAAFNRAIAGNNNFFLLQASGVNRWGVACANAGTGTGNGGADFGLNSYDDAGGLIGQPLVVKRSNGNVGIGTTVPSYTLDISGAPANLVLGATAASGSGLLLQGTNNTGFIRPQASGSTLFLGASNINSVQVNTVGLGAGVFPAYAIDACGSATVASVNIATWSRVPVGNTYVAKGIVAYFTNAPQFSNALQDINSQLAVVTNSGTLGTFFQIRKSGIWAIRVGPISHSTAVSTSVLDVSTNSNVNTMPPIPSVRTIDVNFSTLSISTLNYIGYLPASTTTFYKTYQTNMTATNPAAVFMLSFIAETPTGSANYPYTSYPA
jgi:hypothetical protein